MTDNSRFKIKNGEVSRYALACGYVSTRETAPNVTRTLWHEGAVYHVREHDYNTGKRVFWYSSESLTKARNVYRKKGAYTPSPVEVTNDPTH